MVGFRRNVIRSSTGILSTKRKGQHIPPTSKSSGSKKQGAMGHSHRCPTTYSPGLGCTKSHARFCTMALQWQGIVGEELSSSDKLENCCQKGISGYGQSISTTWEVVFITVVALLLSGKTELLALLENRTPCLLA